MSIDPQSHEELRQALLELQLKDSRSISVKQKLIETQVKLDEEVTRYRKFIDFTQRALKLEDVPSLYLLCAEMLVEAYDFQAGLFLEPQEGAWVVRGACGPSRLMDRTCAIPPQVTELRQAVFVQEGDGFEEVMKALELVEAYIVPVGSQAALVGGTTVDKRDMLGSLPREHASSLSVFGLQARAVLRNFRSGQLVREKNRELEEAHRATVEFFANVSHEIRTPLNALINIPVGLLERVESLEVVECLECEASFQSEEGETVPDECPECGGAGALRGGHNDVLVGGQRELRDLLGAAERNGRYLSAVVEDILDSSKLELGGAGVEPAPLNLEDAISDAIVAVNAQVEAKGVSLDMDVRGSLQCVGDRKRLTQIMVNLIGNALKFSPQGGTIKVIGSRDQEAVRVDVADEGPGIDSAHHELIFQSFRQAPQGQVGFVREHGGTGLGLAIARRLAEAHGGSLTVASRLGEGATFSLSIPHPQPEEASA